MKTTYDTCKADCIEKQQGSATPSVMTAFVWTEHCDNECSGEGIDEEDYNACMSLCSDDNQSSIEGLPGATQPPVMIAQPTGHGGVFGGPRAFLDTDDGISENCSDLCSNNSDYDVCMSDCENYLQGSATPTIMVAEGGCFVNDQGEEVCHGEDGSVIGSAQGTNATTRFASSIRIGDPQPVCDTDAWACFNGTDNESPMIRDVGIFGVFASGDCHHPLGCGY